MNRGYIHNASGWAIHRYNMTLGKFVTVIVMGVFLGLAIFFTNVSANIASFWCPVKAYNYPMQDLLCDFFGTNIYTDAYIDTVDVLLICFCAVSGVFVLLNPLAIYIGLKLMLCIGLSYILRSFTLLVTSLPDSWNMGRRTIYNFYTELNRDRGGDLIFSGHTLLICTFAHAWSSFYLFTDLYILHLITAAIAWSFVLLILIFILVARAHYTIDVLLGFYIASGVWWSTSYFATKFFDEPVCKLQFRPHTPPPMLSTSAD